MTDQPSLIFFKGGSDLRHYHNNISRIVKWINAGKRVDPDEFLRQFIGTF